MQQSLPEEMREAMIEAVGELNRAEHMIYVSLKYTRTVDVFKSIFARLITCFDAVINGLLVQAKNKKLVDDIPASLAVKVDILRKIYADEASFQNYMEFYILFRKVNLAEFRRAREFRRHVCMSALVDGKWIEVNIDIITEYYKRVKSFINYMLEEFPDV